MPRRPITQSKNIILRRVREKRHLPHGTGRRFYRRAHGHLLAHAMLGELTLKITEAVMPSSAAKFLLPLSQEQVEVIGFPHQE